MISHYCWLEMSAQLWALTTYKFPELPGTWHFLILILFFFFQALPVFLEKLNHIRTIFFPTSLERPSCMTGIEDAKLRVESNYIWSDEMSNTISLSSATRWVQVHVVWWDVKHNIFFVQLRAELKYIWV
jgi:hypothetical protein